MMLETQGMAVSKDSSPGDAAEQPFRSVKYGDML